MQAPSTNSSDNPDAAKLIHQLLIVRLGSMGDIIHTLPAATALRRVFPQAEMGWVIEERWAELLCTLPNPRSGRRSPQRPLVDRIHAVNTAKWRKAPFAIQTWQELAAALSDLRAPGYEIAVDFQGAARSALIARASRAGNLRSGSTSRKCGKYALHASDHRSREPHRGAESIFG